MIEGERRLAERSGQAVERKRASGLVVGVPPIGWARGDNGELIEDEHEQAAIARAKELDDNRSLGLIRRSSRRRATARERTHRSRTRGFDAR